MRQKNKIRVIAILLAVGFVFAAYSVYFQQRSGTDKQVESVEFPPTPIIKSDANSQFIETIISGQSSDINTGLRVERLNALAIEGVPPPSVNHITLLILNHTQEPIVFENVGFGVQVFEYYPASSEWKKITLPYSPEDKQKILPPRLEKFDFDALNSWEFTSEELKNVGSNNLRILITGRGMNSTKKYYAFLDLVLQK